MQDLNIKTKARKLASTSVLPFAVLLFAILGAVVVTVVSMAQRASDAADDRARTVLNRAFVEEINDAARQLRAAVEDGRMPSARAVPGVADVDLYMERLRGLGDFDAIALIGPDGKVMRSAVKLIYGQEAPDKRFERIFSWGGNELLRRAEFDANGGAEHSSVGRYLADGEVLRMVTTVRAVPAHAPTAIGLVASRSYDAAGLRQVGGRLSVDRLTLENYVAGGDDKPTSAIGTLDGNGAMRLTWSPDRPGDPILERLIPVATFSALAILIFAWLSFAHVKRVTHNMLTSEEKAQHLAGHDALSGLPNRLRFTEHLTGLLGRVGEESSGVAVLFIDLDKFKEVNDTHGHAAGDLVIVGCAERMARQLRANDVLARFGGDEFAVIQTGVRTPLDAEMLARRLIDSIRPAFQIGEAEAYVGASIGIALAPQNGNDAAELMRLADIAMYRAKNSGRNRACFFEQRMDDTLRIRKVVEDDLRHAIARNELELHYQPQVSSDGSRIMGVEALVRWRHPTLGIIPPGEFIGIAEERGLIVQLGEWVIRRACLDAANWEGITVACNVSAVQFRQVDFVQSVAHALQETGFDPTRLELELTESVVVADADQAESSIMELRSMGVKLALDDFGTGYSSLIYLRRFAFDKIKLDKSFLDSLEDTGESAILVHSVVHLGRALGLTVTAEGVETQEQRRFLQAVGCHMLQGYLFAKPMRVEALDLLLKQDDPFASLAS